MLRRLRILERANLEQQELDKNNNPYTKMPEFGDHVEKEIFEQLLEMDEDQTEHDFSRPLVFGFFEQAAETFNKIQVALDNKDLDELSKLGHFLKGSSATLGFRKIRDSCQVIQQYGHRLTVDGVPEPDEAVCLDNITRALKKAREDTQDLEQLMRQYFGSD